MSEKLISGQQYVSHTYILQQIEKDSSPKNVKFHKWKCICPPELHYSEQRKEGLGMFYLSLLTLTLWFWNTLGIRVRSPLSMPIVSSGILMHKPISTIAPTTNSNCQSLIACRQRNIITQYLCLSHFLVWFWKSQKIDNSPCLHKCHSNAHIASNIVTYYSKLYNKVNEFCNSLHVHVMLTVQDIATNM